MSLLTIVTGALGRMGLPTTATVVGNTTRTVVEMLALLQQEGRELSRRAAWKVLQRETTFTTVAAAAQTDAAALPSDLDWILPETMFNRTLNRQVDGPLSPGEWQQIQSALVTRVNPAFRIRGTSLLLSPTPAAGDTIAYEYVTNKWCQSSGGTAQTAWTADSDTALVDEELHTLGLIWRFKFMKGLPSWEEAAGLYDLQVRQAITREGVRSRLSSDPVWDRNGSDVIAAARGNVILSSDGDSMGWD